MIRMGGFGSMIVSALGAAMDHMGSPIVDFHPMHQIGPGRQTVMSLSRDVAKAREVAIERYQKGRWQPIFGKPRSLAVAEFQGTWSRQRARHEWRKSLKDNGAWDRWRTEHAARKKAKRQARAV